MNAHRRVDKPTCFGYIYCIIMMQKVMKKRSMQYHLPERMIQRLKDHLGNGLQKVALEPECPTDLLSRHSRLPTLQGVLMQILQ